MNNVYHIQCYHFTLTWESEQFIWQLWSNWTKWGTASSQTKASGPKSKKMSCSADCRYHHHRTFEKKNRPDDTRKKIVFDKFFPFFPRFSISDVFFPFSFFHFSFFSIFLTNMSVLKRTDVIRPVAAHQRDVTKIVQWRHDEFLLFGGDASEHLDVGQDRSGERHRFLQNVRESLKKAKNVFNKKYDNSLDKRPPWIKPAPSTRSRAKTVCWVDAGPWIIAVGSNAGPWNVAGLDSTQGKFWKSMNWRPGFYWKKYGNKISFVNYENIVLKLI